MRKKLLIIIGILLMFGFVFLLPGCKKTDDNSNDPEEEVKVEINLTTQTISLKLGETYKINVEVKMPMQHMNMK